MKDFRDILRRTFLLAMVFSLGACAAGAPGGAGGGAGPSGVAPSVIPNLGGMAGVAGGPASATGDGKGTGGDAGDTGDGVPGNGDVAAYGPADAGGQAPQVNGPMWASKTGGIDFAQKPFPGGFPAPTHETPTTFAGIEGQTSVCGVGDKVFLTLDGFVGKAAFPGAPFVDYPNDYTLSVVSKAFHETIASIPLGDKTVYDKTLPNGGGAAVRSGYIYTVVPLGHDNDHTDYPNDLYDLECLLVSKPSRMAEFTEGQGGLRGQRPIPVIPANILHLPNHRKDVPDCPMTKIKEVKGDIENMEKAVGSP